MILGTLQGTGCPWYFVRRFDRDRPRYRQLVITNRFGRRSDRRANDARRRQFRRRKSRYAKVNA